jgi:integrase
LELFFQSRETSSKNDVIALLDAICKKAKQENQKPDDFDFFTMFENYVRIADVSAVRKRNLKTVVNHWRRFEETRGIKISFSTITPEILRDFEKYLKTEGYIPKHKNSSELVSSPKGVNAIHKIMAVTKVFWKFAKKELKHKGIEIQNPFGEEGYQAPTEVYGSPVYITSSERDILFDADLPTDRLKHTRDIFVFQCFIGCRVGDLCKLTKANIQNGVLSYIPRKTKDGRPVTVKIPLHNKALEILSRYDLPGGLLLPFISDQRYNDYIKEVFDAVGITRVVTRRNPNTGESQQVRICDIASSHMARRVFVGNLYGKVDSGIIASMSGHVANSRAFARYYKVDQELQQAAINLF